MKLIRGKAFRAAKFAALIATCALFSSCSRKSADTKDQRPGGGKGAPVPVVVAQVEPKDMPVEIRAIGNVQAYSMVSVRSQITGPLTKVHIQEGQEVNAGDMLFTIDPRPWEAALNQAQANLIRDEAQLVSARLEFERTSNLFESKIASRQDYDTADAAYKALEGTVLADAAAITNAQVSLGYTAIRSPITGRTGNLTVKEGNVVKSPDDIILTITQIHPIYVAFSVPEQRLPAIQRRMKEAVLSVEAVPPGETNNPPRGELTFMDNAVDMSTGQILLKGKFSNADNTLWPGQFVQVSLTLSNLVQATVVPSQAVQTSQNGEFVFVVTPDSTVEMRPVAAGITRDGITVVESGVKLGETVVTDGQLRLVPGAKVSIKAPQASGASTNAPTDKP
jgi:membrane fusion protein, multidrug efflux system